jgi:hypothetical protein
MFTSRDIIYKLFVGRHPDANVLSHPKQVFTALSTFPWHTLVDRGISYVYLLGLWDNAGPVLVTQEEGVDLSDQSKRTPSIFAISNHQQLNPNLGTTQDFTNLISVMREHRLKTIVDFVPNHTATTHPWVSEHPDYYHHGDSGFVAEFSQDVYKLNYENPETVEAMQQVLLNIARMGVDGVRVDMAHLVPLHFWQAAIKRVRSEFPHFIFIAEAYATSLFDTDNLAQLQGAGFDLIYHEALYRNAKKCLTEHEPLTYLSDHLNYYLNNKPLTWLNYVSNHDDPSVGKLKELLSLMLLLPSPLLLYNGSLQGMEMRLAHHTLELLPRAFDDFAHDSTPFDHLLNLRLSGHSVVSVTLEQDALSLRLKDYPEPIHINL